MRDAFVSPLRDRSRCDAAKISDPPSPAQCVNDCACVHVRHHRTCAMLMQECFALTKNACILFFSALKSSHRSTEHRAAMLFTRPAHRRTHAPRPLQVAVASKTSIVVTSDSMGSAAQPASPRRSGRHRMRCRARHNLPRQRSEQYRDNGRRHQAGIGARRCNGQIKSSRVTGGSAGFNDKPTGENHEQVPRRKSTRSSLQVKRHRWRISRCCSWAQRI